MATSSDAEALDLLIVGAGVYGICAANTYLTLHPTANILILDGDKDVGGVWSRTRLYPIFWSQSPVRLVGYHDIPFKLPDDAETYHDLFEAKYVTRYLEEYVSSQRYDGRSLRERCVFECRVRHITKSGSGQWVVEAGLKGEDVIYKCTRLIIAVGLTETPNIPSLPNRDQFKGMVIHQEDFGSSKLFTADEENIDKHTNITVLGGAKSAADMVYAAAIDTHPPRKVSWIIRKSGSGPLLLEHPEGFWRYRSAPEVGSTRAIALMSSANPFVGETWWSWFLHKTSVGEWLLEKFWSWPEHEAAAVADFGNRKGAKPGFAELESQTKLRWMSGPLGLLQRDDFWDVIARGVDVYRQDIKGFKHDAVVLEDGTEVATHVLLCGTGWIPDRPFFDDDEATRLGLPVVLEDDGPVKGERQRWHVLEEEAGHEDLRRWPNLQKTEEFKAPDVRRTPYRLYNGCIPIDDHSIAFLGIVQLPNHFLAALVESLWTIAIFDGKLYLPQRQDLEKRVAFVNAWCKRRYPVTGLLGNVFEFEMMSYLDGLLDDLKLSSHRAHKSWFATLTDPCLMPDYAGLLDEYRGRYGF